MNLGDMWSIALTFVLVGVVLVFGVVIVSDVRADLTDTDAEAAANSTIDGLSTMAGKLPILAVIVVAALIIGVLVSSFSTA